MKHYLISLPMPHQGVDMHCYLMTNNQADTERAANKMMYEIERAGGTIVLPLLLLTELSAAGTRKVRKVLLEGAPDGGQTLREATDFHLTVWGMPHRHPDNVGLLELH